MIPEQIQGLRAEKDFPMTTWEVETEPGNRRKSNQPRCATDPGRKERRVLPALTNAPRNVSFLRRQDSCAEAT